MVVEVLSASTEAYDRGEKREHYQQLESLREYVLVAQDRRRVEVFRREAGGVWEHRVATRRDVFELPSLALTIAVAELYDRAGVCVTG